MPDWGGAHTVAITGNPDGWLAQESDTIVDQSVRLAGELIGMPSNPGHGRRGTEAAARAHSGW